MSIRQICAKRLILAVDPHAFDEGTLLAEVERNEQRIANDPEIQERKRLVNEKHEREYAPFFLFGSAVMASIWGAMAFFLPNLVTIPGAALGIAVMNGVWCLMNQGIANPRLVSLVAHIGFALPLVAIVLAVFATPLPFLLP